MSDKEQPPLKVVTLHESNYRDIVAALRLVADQIERGEFGQVNDCAMANQQQQPGLGGQLAGAGAAAGVSMIPGVGPFLAPVAGNLVSGLFG